LLRLSVAYDKAMDALEPIYQRCEKGKAGRAGAAKSQRLQSRPTAAYAKLNKVDPAVQRVETTAGMSASMHRRRQQRSEAQKALKAGQGIGR
jgi:hypothetical protein